MSVKTQCEKQLPKSRDYQIVWSYVVLFTIIHIQGLYGLYLVLFYTTFSTTFFSIFASMIMGFGSTAGTHRLWTHRSYKAKLPLRIVLMILQTACLHRSIKRWCRDHRLHHKYTDTEADPHNSTRGLFFSHIGWLMVRPTEEVKQKGRAIDISDLDADPVVVFQKKYYAYLAPFFGIVAPTLIPWYFFGETLMYSYFANAFRIIFLSHWVFTVNSFAHLADGARPYDKNIKPCHVYVECALSLGEGNHNYHHVFPWDYRTDEIDHDLMNVTTMLLRFCAWIGQAYDLKTASVDMIKARCLRTGDGTRVFEDHLIPLDCRSELNGLPDGKHAHFEEEFSWDDSELREEEKNLINVLYKREEVVR